MTTFDAYYSWSPQKRKGILFVISGPSGVGKGTVREALLAGIKDIRMSVSATTRPPREGEIDGQDYFFISQDKFEQMIAENRLLEWAPVYDNMYGTPRDFVVGNLEQGYDVLLEIDIKGALQVREKMPEGVFVFIAPPNLEELARRLCSRGKDSEDSIEKRLAACAEEMAHMKYYQYLVVNDRIADAVNKLWCIIMAERCRINHLDLG